MTTKPIKRGQRVGWYNLFGIRTTGRVEVVGTCECGVRLPPPEDSEGVPNNELVWVDIKDLVDPVNAPVYKPFERRNA